METIKAIVLAAGKGTRLQTGDIDTPKVMREVCGKPLLWFVLDALTFIEKKDIIIVVGYKKNDILDCFSGYSYAEQTEQLGTGHAVLAAAEKIMGFNGAVLVCYGDMPAIKKETYKALVNTHFEQGNDCTVLTGESEILLPYGRIIRDKNGAFVQVVEDIDCTPEELKITELNSGVYVFNAKKLLQALEKLSNDNAQGEYYITDVPVIMRDNGAKVGIYKRDLGEEIIGVNTTEQLDRVGEILKKVMH